MVKFQKKQHFFPGARENNYKFTHGKINKHNGKKNSEKKKDNKNGRSKTKAKKTHAL